MPIVSVRGWKPGFKTISFMKLLREGAESPRTLAEAKSMVDGLLEGRHFTVSFARPEEAETFVKSAEDYGVVVCIQEPGETGDSGAA